MHHIIYILLRALKAVGRVFAFSHWQFSASGFYRFKSAHTIETATPLPSTSYTLPHRFLLHVFPTNMLGLAVALFE